MKNFIKSLFTDKEWDGDAVKTIGFFIIIAGLVGFFLQKTNFQWLIVTGAGMLGTGKVAEELSNGN